MKAMKTLSLCAALLTAAAAVPVSPVTVFAEGEEALVYQGMKYEVNDGEVTITEHTEELPAEVVIPAEIDGKPVTIIGNNAFYECTGLTAVTIPNSVISIGGAAFYRCESLESITIPEGVTKIGIWAFCNCSNLESITIPDSVTEIDTDAFYGTKWLQKQQAASPDHMVIVNHSVVDTSVCAGDITVPDGVTTIPVGLFSNNKKVISVKLPDSVSAIRQSAFADCTGLQSITLPNSVSEVESEIFSRCAGLESVKLSESLTKIAQRMFSGCASLVEITLPDSVSVIEDSAFSDCTSLKSITIPETVAKIDNMAFSKSALQNITILNPNCEIFDSSLTICNSMPEYTTKINTLENKDGVYTGTIRGYNGSTAQAYAEKYNRTFEPLDAIPEPQEGMTWALSDDGTLTISGSGSMGEYGWADELPWYERAAEIKKAVIENGITDIADYAFYGCENLADVSIPASVTTIGESAFEMCSSLKSVSLPAGITEMKMYAFANSGITSVSIPAGVGTLESCIFQSCAGLTSVVIPENITRIKNDAFYSCENLAEITIPATVKSIGGNAFTGTAWLAARQKENPCVTVNGILIDGKACTESVTVPAGITEIADDAFRGSGITGIVIPEGVTRIGARAFSGIKPLAEITIPASVTEIGEEAFLKTAWLTAMQTANPLVIVNHIVIDGTACTGDVTIPADVTFIESSAFYRATGLTSIVIPEGVPAIGDHTFDCCDNLTAVTLPESITYIGEHAFDFCDKLKEVTVPASTKSIDYAAFRGCRNLSAFTILNPDCEIWDENTTICNHNEGEGPFFTGKLRGYDSSTAEAYAKKYGCAFESLGAAPLPAVSLRGDLDLSKVVDVADAVILARYLVGDDSFAVSDQGLANADADGSGKLTTDDVNYIVRMIVGLV